MKENFNTLEISHDGIDIEAITAKAKKRRDVENPYISLSKLWDECRGNDVLESCLRDMVQYALRYAETVCRFEQIVLRGQQSNEDGERAEIEKIRTTTDDASIDSINILSRNLRNAGKNNKWIGSLVNGGRPAYTKFAMLIAFEEVLGKVQL